MVWEAVAGFAAAHPDIVRYDPVERIVVRADAPVAGKVGLVSAGGSGCEPLHNGFVGFGMLDAACPGEVFTSPVPDQLIAATAAADGGAGILQVVKNYPGEVMNFKPAGVRATGVPSGGRNAASGIELFAYYYDNARKSYVPNAATATCTMAPAGRHMCAAILRDVRARFRATLPKGLGP